MFRTVLRVAAAALLVSTSVFSQSEREIALGHMEGQVVLKFKDGVGAAVQAEWLRAAGLEVLLPYRSFPGYLVRFAGGIDAARKASELAADERIEWAHPNYLGRRTTTVPNDASFANCWYHQNTGQTVNGDTGTADADIDSTDAWDIRHDATPVILAIVDSGARMTHQDLTANIWANAAEIPGNGIDDDGNTFIDDINGWDFLQNDNSPTDSLGHGTNCLGVIAARGNNSVGIAGVCWEARAMILKDGNAIPQVALSAAGIEYAAQNGAVVCNFSTGYGNGSFPVLQTAINTAQTYGMILCVAAGNSTQNLNTSPDYPACYLNDNILVVAASTNDDQMAAFSNYGSTFVDVAAPGTSMRTTNYTSNTAYTYVDGTSFSAPITTGCIAILRAQSPTSGYLSVKSTLIGSCDVLAPFTGLVASGGRVNLKKALDALTSPAPNPMTFAQTPIAAGPGAITMTATTATTASGQPVEYSFELAGQLGTGGTASGWQSSSTYVDTGLSANGVFSYRVKARNAVTLAETSASTAFGTSSEAAVPGAPNVTAITNDTLTIASLVANGNPTTTSYAVRVGALYVQSNGTLGATESWGVATLWINRVVIGLTPFTNYSVEAKARNVNLAQTAFGPATAVTTTYLGPAAAGIVGQGAGGPYNLLTINGQTGGTLRRVQVGVGQALTFGVAQPPTYASPAGLHVIGWVGIPTPNYETSLGASVGTTVFPPCEIAPGLSNFTAFSTLPASPCGPLVGAGPTPFSYSNPGFPYPIFDITFQAIVQTSVSGWQVANAVILNYQ